MLDDLLPLACLGALALMGTGIGAIIWLVGRASASSRLTQLEREVAWLRATVQRLIAVREPAPVRREPAAPARVPEPVPAAALPEPVRAAPAPEPVAPRSEPEPAREPEIAAPPPPPPPSPPPPSQPAAPGGGWERLLGVRLASALGALVLVLAGLYFFRYSIEHGLISPAVRVAMGIATGIVCLVSAETFLRARYASLAPWIAGAGIAILYLASWAAAPLYALVPTSVAGVLMILVTATCCILAVKRGSTPVAILGLLGGFATPLLLSTGQDRPVALFTYLLLLDVALLFVAHRRGWAWLALLALAGTTLYQGLWIGGRMGSELDRVLLGMLIVVVFAALFAIAGALRPRGREDSATRALDLLIRAASTLLPFLFAFYFAARADIGPHLWPTAALLAVLVTGATFVARRHDAAWLGLSAACAAFGVLAAWILVHPIEGAIAWEVVGFAGVVALALHAEAELDRARRIEPMLAAIAWTLGALLLTTIAAARNDTIEAAPWLLLCALLTVIGLRQARFDGAQAVYVLLSAMLALAFSVLSIAHGGEPGMPDPRAMLALSVGLSAAYALASVWARRASVWASRGAALLAVLLAIHVAIVASTLPIPTLELAAAGVMLALIAGLSALRHEPGAWVIVGAAFGALVLGAIVAAIPEAARSDLALVLGAHGLLAAALTALPFAAPAAVRERRWTWRGVALAGPILFPTALQAHRAAAGMEGVASVPLVLALVAVLAAAGLQRRGPADPAARRSATAWVAGAAIALVTLAIPLELDNEWLTIGWAVQSAALLLLWRRLDHAGLKWIALALAATVTVRLAFNPWVLEYAPRGPIPILSWLSYTYLVPFAALLAGFFLLRREEAARLRPSERSVFGDRALGAQLLALAAIAILFVWMNLAIFDVYATGPSLEIPLDRMPARDLTLSIGWAVYALGLLALGMWRKSTPLRVLSLALMLITTSKVFLYDLSQLRDLYRVASLAGLAVALILISFAYQRFVFRRLAPEAS